MTKPKNTSPPPPKPWDVLPTESKGNADPDEIYYAVGRTLYLWERLDERHARLFAVLVNSRAGAAEDAYGMVQSPSSRSAMIEAAARAIFEPKDPLLVELIKLLNEVAQLSGRRNDIAHGLVQRFRSVYVKVGAAEHDDAEVTNTLHGYFLTSSSANTRKRLGKEEAASQMQAGIRGRHHYQKYAYTAAQIRIYANHFSAYEDLLEDITKRVKVYCESIWPPPPKSPPQTIPRGNHQGHQGRRSPKSAPPPSPSPASPRKRVAKKRRKGG